MAMMFRGLGKPTDQLDIQLAQPGSSEFAPMGVGAMPMTSPLPAPPAPEPQKIGTGRMIAGFVGDALAQLGGMRGNFMPAMQQHQEMMRRAQQQQQQRMADRDDWLWKAQWERDNPKAPTPSEFERRLMEGGIMPGTPEWRAANRGAAESVYNPIVNASVGGRDFFGPRSLLMSEFGKGGDQTISPSPGATPPPAADGGFMTLDQFDTMRTVPTFKPGHPAWDTPVEIRSEAEYSLLPSGKTYRAPDGSVRKKQ